MRISRSTTRLAVLAGVAALALSGCGVSDAVVQPGVAADVDGTTLSVAEVDETAMDTCEVFSAAGQLGGSLTGAFMRDLAVDALVRVEVISQIAEENGMDADAMLEGDEADARTQLEQIVDSTDLTEDQISDEVVRFVAANNFFSDVLLTVAGTDTDDQRQYLADWQDEHEIVVNPVYDAVDLAASVQADETADLSVAVSDTARDLINAEMAEALGQGDGSYAAAMPAGQACQG
ncbi:hypothetical protein [Nocardioides bruguierae]|uniref:hypothetical protein n=1 Tax=Nocardioides bruguierae TaxID=2945102 RepID=UPI002021FC84|nr:hypothetical protein [Nocardioides bruguierae]MCL8027227.1 hypothetical protein [Nocardioides bruguierae]